MTAQSADKFTSKLENKSQSNYCSCIDNNIFPKSNYCSCNDNNIFPKSILDIIKIHIFLNNFFFWLTQSNKFRGSIYKTSNLKSVWINGKKQIVLLNISMSIISNRSFKSSSYHVYPQTLSDIHWRN